MEGFINDLLDMGMGQYMDTSRQELIKTDELYRKYLMDEGKFERQCMNLGLPDEQKSLINDYIDSIKTCDNRYSDISYMAGIKDAVRMFCCLGLLKDMKASDD